MNRRTIPFQSKRFSNATANAARGATTLIATAQSCLIIIVVFIRRIVVIIYAITVLAIWFKLSLLMLR